MNRNNELNQRIQTPKDPNTTNQGLLKPLLGALGPSLDGLGGLLGNLDGVLGCFWELLGPLCNGLGGPLMFIVYVDFFAWNVDLW